MLLNLIIKYNAECPGFNFTLPPQKASATVAIPKEHHRFVIGKNGEKLQELELKTATKIQIPRPDDPSNQIKISGTKEGLEKAKHEILLISAEQVTWVIMWLDFKYFFSMKLISYGCVLFNLLISG